MPATEGQTVPLLARPADAVLFHRPTGPVTAATFLADAARLAAALPAAPPTTAPAPVVNAPVVNAPVVNAPVMNLCADRYRFALGIAACALAGRPSLLTGDRSPAWLASLAGRYPGMVGLGDPDTRFTLPAGVPLLRVADAARAAAPGPPPHLPADQPAAIVFTSGSTGEPVGHRKTWGGLAARSIAAGHRFGLSRSRPASIIGTIPPQHMYGFETTVLLPLHAAGASWCGPAFYPTDVAAALAACPEPRVLVTTPLQLRALLAADIPLGPLARVISATAPLDAAMAAAAEQRWQTEVWEIFGATEVGSIASRRTTAGPDWRLYPGVQLAATADDSPDTPGRHVAVHARHSTPTRLNDRLDLTGSSGFRLLGRDSDLIKLGGRRASLAGLTRILTDIAGVEDGIFVAPDDLETRPTARLLAFAVAPELAAETILAELRTRVDPLFLPRRVIRLDRLPRDPLGKLPARALAALRDASEGG
jgi:acyl-coenzyme A synthetase/AMP-(fatty) acid ligase